jgi:hypothetical protein
LTIGENLITSNDVLCKGTIFTPELKVWKDDSNVNQRVGFGFRVNDSNQFELCKFVSDASGSVIKRVAMWGTNNDTLSNSDFTDDSWSYMGDLLSNAAQPNITVTAAGGAFNMNALGHIYTSSNVHLGVGLSNPTYPLQVAGTIYTDSNVIADTVTASYFTMPDGTQLSTIILSDTNSNAFIPAGSNLGIGTEATDYPLTVDGIIYSTSNVVGQSFQTSSDSRAKTDVVTLDVSQCLDDVSHLVPVSYKLVDDQGTQRLGFIAQAVQSVIPEAVFTSPNPQYGIEDFLYIDTTSIVSKLVGAVKSLQARVEALEAAA